MAPPLTTAQLWAAPAETAVAPDAITVVGVSLSSVVPSPSWPELFRPQHCTAPENVKPQLCPPPTDTALKVSVRRSKLPRDWLPSRKRFTCPVGSPSRDSTAACRVIDWPYVVGLAEEMRDVEVEEAARVRSAFQPITANAI